jgi:LysM repeat protein
LPPRRARPDRPLPPAPTLPPRPRAAADVYHFQPGDTLYSLARWARTSLAALRAANPDVDPRDIEVGDPIRLPPGAARPEPLRLRERGRPSTAAVAPPPPPPPSPAARPPRPPAMRPPPPPEADKPAGDEEGTPGGMDDGGPEPDGM